MSTPELPSEDHGAGAGGPPDDAVLAAELALGVLSAGERRAALERVAKEPRFAGLVARWEEHFSPWLESIDPADPSPAVWKAIERRLGWSHREGRSPWQSLGLWRTLTALASVTAVVIWLARSPAPVAPPTANLPPTSQAPARPVTTLAQDNGTPGWLASVDRAHGTVLMVPVPRARDPQGRVPELWLIAAGQAPRSLGRVSIDESNTVAVPADSLPALVPGSVLAVTLEPPAGVPHAAPTGPIIAKGAI